MLLIFHLCDAVTLWRHVMTSQNRIYLSQLVDVLESWFFFLFPWFFRSLSSKLLLIVYLCDDVTSWRHVMMSQNLIYLSQFVDVLESWFLFLFPWFFRSLSSKIWMIFNFVIVLASWRYVMTSLKLLHLSQVMDLLERWSCSWFHGFSGCLCKKC